MLCSHACNYVTLGVDCQRHAIDYEYTHTNVYMNTRTANLIAIFIACMHWKDVSTSHGSGDASVYGTQSQTCRVGSAKLPIQCHNGSTTEAHVLLKSTCCSLHLPPVCLATQLKEGEGMAVWCKGC